MGSFSVIWGGCVQYILSNPNFQGQTTSTDVNKRTCRNVLFTKKQGTIEALLFFWNFVSCKPHWTARTLLLYIHDYIRWRRAHVGRIAYENNPRWFIRSRCSTRPGTWLIWNFTNQSPHAVYYYIDALGFFTSLFFKQNRRH